MPFLPFCFVYIYLTIVSGGHNCPAKPLLRVSTVDRTQFSSPSTTENGDQFLYFQNPITLFFECRANEPIQIEVEALMVEAVEDVVFSREVRSLFESETYCYVVTFYGNPNYRITGKYVCSVIGNKERSSSIFIFADSERGSILLNNGTQQLIKGFPDDDGWITIPCVTTNPNMIPTISRLSLLTNLKKSPVLSLEEGSVEYSVGRGFRIKATSPQCCSNEYICELRPDSNSDVNSPTYTTVLLYKTEAISEKVFFRVSPSDYVLGFNPEYETKLRLPLLSETRISCESNVKVDLEIQNPGLTKPGLYKSILETNENSFYQEKATLLFKTNKVVVIAIICRAEKSKQELHRWEITSVMNSEDQSSPGIHFFKNKRYPIACFSSNGERPSISIIQCIDDISCRIAESKSHLMLKEDSNGKDVFPFDLIPGHPFCVKDRQAANALACAEVSPYLGSKRGIVKCREVQPDKNYIVYTENFLIGLNNSIVQLPQDPVEEAGKNTHGSAVLQMDPTKTILYVDEELSVRCTASYGVFSLGIQIMFQLQNNTNLTSLDFRRLNFKEDLHNHVITFEGAVKIETPQIQQIWCFAPIWNSPNWRSVSHEVTIKVGLPPFIWHSSENETRDFGLGEIGHNLRCAFGGDPFPRIRWTKDKDELSEKNTKVMSIETLGNSSWLQLSPIVESHVGVYTCEARNVKGKVYKTYIVKLTNTGMFQFYIYLGVALGVLMFASLVICVIIILRTDKALLTEAEIEEFLRGSRVESRAAHPWENTEDLVNLAAYCMDYEVPVERIQIYENAILGQGEFGTVYKGKIEINDENFEIVAIKIPKSNSSTQHVKSLMSELKLMTYINGNPYLVRLVAAHTEQIRKGILYVAIEFCPKGSLEKLLRKSVYVDQKNEPNNYDTSGNSRRNFVRFKQLNEWSLQISQGMNYLFTKKIIHGDLAARNVLVAADNSIRIADFGLSRHLYEYTNYVKQSQEPLPWRWMAIESLRYLEFSSKSDIWAFGVTIWEIFSLGDIPYPGLSWDINFAQKLEQGLRSPHPKYANEETFAIMLQCWHLDPNIRPSFAKLAEHFNESLYIHV